MLYLVATPIGNLKDITVRALEVLSASDYVLCEDTRHSAILFNTYGIKKPLKRFCQFNEKEMEDGVVADLHDGKEISLISDAGTPGICDPGERLVRRCYKEKLPFTALPGPCAWAVALSLSPFSKDCVQFLGFLSKKPEERKRLLAHALSSPCTTIFYEAPHRLLATLRSLPPHRKISVLRELTKKFEEKTTGTAQEVGEHFQKNSPKGECAVVIERAQESFSHLSPQQHVAYLEETYQLSKNDAIKIAAQLRNIPKRYIYQKIQRKGAADDDDERDLV